MNENAVGWFILGAVIVWSLSANDGVREVTVYEVSCSEYGIEVMGCAKPNYLRTSKLKITVLIREQRVANPEHHPNFLYRCEVIDERNWWCIDNQDPQNVIRMNDGRYFNEGQDYRGDGKILRHTGTGFFGWLGHLYWSTREYTHLLRFSN